MGRVSLNSVSETTRLLICNDRKMNKMTFAQLRKKHSLNYPTLRVIIDMGIEKEAVAKNKSANNNMVIIHKFDLILMLTSMLSLAFILNVATTFLLKR